MIESGGATGASVHRYEHSAADNSVALGELKAGRPTRVTDPSGKVVDYEYGSNRQTKFIKHADQTFEAFCYNALGQVTRQRDRLGRITRTTFDTRGNLLTHEVGLQDSATNVPVGFGNNSGGTTSGGNGSGSSSGSHDGSGSSGSHDSSGSSGSYGGSGSSGSHGGSGSSTPLVFSLTGYDPCAPDDVQTADYALTSYEYFPEGHVAQFLLKATIDPLGHRTDSEYDAQQRLSKVIQPADVAGGPRAETTYAYDAGGRLQTVTDAEGYETTYFYDGHNRQTKVAYHDGSSERFFFGTGPQANLLVKQVDRRGVVTHHEYDAAGRRSQTTSAAGLMDFAGSETPVADPSTPVVETLTYLTGTEQIASRTRGGERTDYVYDHLHRIIETRVQPNAATTLVSRQTYVGQQLFATTDPYERKTFHAYDATDGRLIRSIQASVPSVTYADPAAVLAAVRPPAGTANPTSIITDYLYDAEGQTTSVVDPRGIASTTGYDSRGRVVEQVQAASVVGTGGLAAIPAKTETIYDAVGHAIEVRAPRYFDASDTTGQTKARTTMAYTGRGRLLSRTDAPGTPEAATEAYAYDIAGRQSSRTDARGHVWQTLQPNCCGRVQVSIDPLGHGSITRTNWGGQATHVVQVADVASHQNHADPDNAKTLSEVTTKFDERGRPVARTVWLAPRGAVDEHNPPIAGDNGIAAAAGLTTRYSYDDNLTDGVGLDQQFAAHFAGLNLGAGSDGSATLVTNSAGERTLAIKDGAGRSVKSVQLSSPLAPALGGEGQGEGASSAVVSGTTTHDVMTTIAGYGSVLETSQANALGHTHRSRTDGAGRTIQSVDAENRVTSFEYDAHGNRLKVRDANGVGQDCQYDALNRDILCADTQELLDGVNRRKEYDLAGNVRREFDAKNNAKFSYYDSRNRLFETKDRNNATTTFTFDAAGNELSMTDAENQTTSYEYDPLGRRTKIVWPDHVAGQQPGDGHYGTVTTAYDAAGRAVLTTDQQGDTIARVYDLAGRMPAREYRTLANSTVTSPNTGLSPFVTGNIADADTFTYDAAGRMLTAIKGRYSNTVTFTYENGRKLTEALTLLGQTYTVTSGYDAAGRENSLTYPDGSIVTRTHTNRGQLASVNLADPNAAPSSIATFAYDNGGRETSRTYGNGVTTTRSYAADNMLTSIAAAGVETLSYTYDANKNPTGETRPGVMAAYSWATGQNGFDNQNRLTGWSRTNGDAQTWTLSPVNDWQSFTNNGSTQTRTHGPTHEVLSVTNAGNPTPAALQHDAKGNLTQDDRGCLLSYDADNMLSAFGSNNVAGLKDATYSYDALGRRVAKSVTTPASGNNPASTATTTYVLTNQQVIAEYSSSNAGPATLSTRQTHGTYIDEPLVLLSTVNNQPSTLYYHTNRQYSVYALTDATGAAVERYAYTPYGQHRTFDASGIETVNSQPVTANRTLFTGRTLDIESGLHYFRARYFSTTLGRFTSHDPIEYPDGWNSYSGWFAVVGIDPSGLAKIVGNDDGYPIYQAGPGDMLVPPNSNKQCYYTSQYGPIWIDCPVIPKDEPVGTTFSGGLQGLYDSFNLLEEACNKCCNGCKCTATSRSVVAALMDAWAEFYGTGPEAGKGGIGSDYCGGYMCYDWTSVFDNRLKNNANLGGCFQVQIQAAAKPGKKKNDPFAVHFWVKITAGKGGPGCEVFVDDGWGNGSTSNVSLPLNKPSDWQVVYPEQITLPRSPIDPNGPKPNPRKPPQKPSIRTR